MAWVGAAYMCTVMSTVMQCNIACSLAKAFWCDALSAQQQLPCCSPTLLAALARLAGMLLAVGTLREDPVCMRPYGFA